MRYQAGKPILSGAVVRYCGGASGMSPPMASQEVISASVKDGSGSEVAVLAGI